MSDDLVKRLTIKAGCIEMCEKIEWGSDTAIMREAADRIEEMEAKLEKARAILDSVNECMFSAAIAEYEMTKHIDGALERKNARLALFRQARAALAEQEGE